MGAESKSFDLHNNYDVVMARQHARELARNLGFGLTDQTRIATAVSEVARHALEHQGSMSFVVVKQGERRGIECTCLGCAWHEAAPRGGPGNALGGLRGLERLMDDFEVRREGPEPPTVVMRKWLTGGPAGQNAP
jgi:serine/threonine-protein kinase RsbT